MLQDFSSLGTSPVAWGNRIEAAVSYRQSTLDCRGQQRGFPTAGLAVLPRFLVGGTDEGRSSETRVYMIGPEPCGKQKKCETFSPRYIHHGFNLLVLLDVLKEKRVFSIANGYSYGNK